MNQSVEIDYQEKIINHYSSIWKNNSNLYLWDKGPFEKLPFNFRVLEFAPTDNRNMWTYATCCMSQPEDKRPIEVHIFSAKKDTGIIELLTAVAYYHRNTSLLNLNHTVNFGRPWQDTSLCEYGFISLPYLDGPELENLTVSELKIEVKFYWLIPLMKKEIDYKSKFGVEALEERFDSGSLDYINTNRSSLV
jgi:hypothetical protein